MDQHDHRRRALDAHRPGHVHRHAQAVARRDADHVALGHGLGLDPGPRFGDRGQAIGGGVVEVVHPGLAIRGRGDEDLLAHFADTAIEAVVGARQERVDPFLDLLQPGIEPERGPRVGEIADAEHGPFAIDFQAAREIVALGRKQRRALVDTRGHVDHHQPAGFFRVVQRGRCVHPVVRIHIDRCDVVIRVEIGLRRADPGIVGVGLPVHRFLPVPLRHHRTRAVLRVQGPIEDMRGRTLRHVPDLAVDGVHPQQRDVVEFAGVREHEVFDDDVVRPVAHDRVQQVARVERALDVVGGRPIGGVLFADDGPWGGGAVDTHGIEAVALPILERGPSAIADAVDQAVVVDPGNADDIGLLVGDEDAGVLEVAGFEDRQLQPPVGRRHQRRQALAGRRHLQVREVGGLVEVGDRNRRRFGRQRTAGGCRQQAERHGKTGSDPLAAG